MGYLEFKKIAYNGNEQDWSRSTAGQRIGVTDAEMARRFSPVPDRGGGFIGALSRALFGGSYEEADKAIEDTADAYRNYALSRVKTQGQPPAHFNPVFVNSYPDTQMFMGTPRADLLYEAPATKPTHELPPDNPGDAEISDELTAENTVQEQAPVAQQTPTQDDYQYATKPMTLGQKAQLAYNTNRLLNRAEKGINAVTGGVKSTLTNTANRAINTARAGVKGTKKVVKGLGKELADNITPYEIKADAFNSDPWKKLTTDADRDKYLLSQMQPFIASRMAKAKLSGEKNLPATNDTAGWLRYIRQNEDAKKELEAAFKGGDMGFVEYMQRLEQRANSPEGIGFKNASLNLWQSLTSEEQAEFKGYMQSAVWKNIKADWFNNIPKAIGLWLRSFGWNGAADFAANPLHFYGSLALAFIGGSMLLEGQEEDGESAPSKKRDSVYDAIMNAVPYGG